MISLFFFVLLGGKKKPLSLRIRLESVETTFEIRKINEKL